MSDLHFARELGAEFARLEQAEEAGWRRPRHRAWRADLPVRVATAVAVAIPLAIAALMIALLSPSHPAGPPPASTGASDRGLGFGGGNCRTPARTVGQPPGSPAVTPTPDGMIRAAGGRVSGIAWQLRVKPLTETLGATEHGRLSLGAGQYGLCSLRPVPVPFGLVDAGPRGIVYGYVEGAGSYRITVSAGSTPLASSVTDTFFFIGALPRPACSYRALTVTATATPVTGLPPAIDRSLDASATHFTTTMRFGACRSHALVTVASEHGLTQGRSPNAPLAQVIQQQKLLPASPRSHAMGTVFELAHGGLRGVNVLAFGLSPGRFGIWLLDSHNRITALGAATVRHELRRSYDLPADVTGTRQIVISVAAPGQSDSPGRIVLRARLR